MVYTSRGVLSLNFSVGIIGLGYVGLPLAIASAAKYRTFGFDIDSKRIANLNIGKDITNEVDSKQFLNHKNLFFTTEIRDLSECTFFIITVPTPIDSAKLPDLHFLSSASELIGSILKKGDTVVYESTVYPGATEEFCIPILEKVSRMKLNIDFYAGYSPERINPGDKSKDISQIKKVVSGSTKESSQHIQDFYNSIITAGTYLASSIKVAEAAKVIENTQRDLNIALINELSILFNLLEIDTNDVLDAAETKWNFHRYQPGLVGGHCISVDPYYLTFKAKSIGYEPKIILSGREINDNMYLYVANRFVTKLMDKCNGVAQNVLILGGTFKENCPDMRNSGSIKLAQELTKYENLEVYLCDPWINRYSLSEMGNVKIIDFKSVDYPNFDAIIVAVSHLEFREIDWRKINNLGILIFDLKNIVPRNLTFDRL
jgi:UDP-N-acetyl-D-galactosamine dehydrogenase